MLLIVLLFCSIISAEAATAIATSLMFLVTAYAAYYAKKEYTKHIENERTKLLCEYNQRYADNTDLRNVIKWMLKVAILNEEGDIIDAEPNRLSDRPGIYEKEMFMRFFEELNIHMKSGNISKTEACKLFSYYAIKFGEIKNFRLDITDYKTEDELSDLKKKMEKESDKTIKDKLEKEIKVYRLVWADFRAFVTEMAKERQELMK